VAGRLIDAAEDGMMEEVDGVAVAVLVSTS
jgi:hypothetical protein